MKWLVTIVGRLGFRRPHSKPHRNLKALDQISNQRNMYLNRCLKFRVNSKFYSFGVVLGWLTGRRSQLKFLSTHSTRKGMSRDNVESWNEENWWYIDLWRNLDFGVQAGSCRDYMLQPFFDLVRIVRCLFKSIKSSFDSLYETKFQCCPQIWIVDSARFSTMPIQRYNFSFEIRILMVQFEALSRRDIRSTLGKSTPRHLSISFLSHANPTIRW